MAPSLDRLLQNISYRHRVAIRGRALRRLGSVRHRRAHPRPLHFRLCYDGGADRRHRDPPATGGEDRRVGEHQCCAGRCLSRRRGTTIERNGKVGNAEIAFGEIRRGDVRSGAFEVNGDWAERHTGIAAARPVMLSIAGYLRRFDYATLQRLLDEGHFGLNDRYARTYSLAGIPHLLRMSQEIRDRQEL
jgi:hypothetical protein